MSRNHPRRRARPPLLSVEALELRRLLSVAALRDAANPGEWIVTLAEDRAGTSDTLRLRVNASGELAFQLNGGPVSNDLDSTVPGVQALRLEAISRIVVTLGGGDDRLIVDGVGGPVIPARYGIVYDGGAGLDSLDVATGGSGSYLPGPGSTDGLVIVDSRAIRFTGIEPATVSGLASFTFITPGSTDVLTIDSPAAGQNRISGTSDGAAFEALTFFNITSLTVDTALNDGAIPDDAITVTGAGLVASGLRDFTVRTGPGRDSLNVAAPSFALPAGGSFTFNAGAGIDRIAASSNVSYTLTSTALSSSAGGTIVLSGVDEASLTGGNSGNLLDATGFDGPVTLDGGNGNDTLRGGPGDDVLTGGQGSELLFGNGGNDTITGGTSGSTLRGGAGNDLLKGDNGKDFLYGEEGDDTLLAGNGVDLLDGGPGNDRLSGQSGNDSILGGAGTDTVAESSDSNFTLTRSSLTITGQGTDFLDQVEHAELVGGPSANTLDASGFSGSVTLDGGGGNDTLIGGTGFNRFLLGLSGAVTVHANGYDVLDFTRSPSRVSITLTLVAGETQPYMPGASVAVIGIVDEVAGGDRGNTFVGGSRPSLLFGGTGDDSIIGGTGSTTIVGGGGRNTLFGGSGDDSIVGGNGSNTIVGGDGRNTLFGGSGDDSIVGGNGSNTIVGGDGRNTLFGGAGDDSIVGGNGSNTIVGGDGRNTLFGGTGDDSIVGGNGSNTIVGGGGRNTLFGGTGDDSIVGGSGDVNIPVSGSNLIRGGDGDDMIVGGNGGDILFGGAGFDTIDGDQGDDVIFGGDDAPGSDGGDIIFGGPGDDYITGGEGDDLLDGGDGSDTYRFPGGNLGSDTVHEGANVDSDWLDFSSFAGPVALDLARITPQEVSPGNLILTLTSPTGIENVLGSAFVDSITGNARSNRLAGADPLDDRGGPAPSWNGVTQWVRLDFDSFTDPGEHVYTETERADIQARIASIYSAFHFAFTQLTPPVASYATLFFNKSPIVNGVPQPGGQADEVDWRNVNLGGTAAIDVNGFLGGTDQPEASAENVVALTATVGAHELGHLVGLLHSDAFGPPGTGVNDPPGAGALFPAYPGPNLAYETRYHLMATPASAGTSLEDAIAGPFLGEREAVKLAFAESGTGVAEQVTPHRSIADAQPLTLTSLAVPNTLLRGLNLGKAFAVAAVNVLGAIELVSPGGVSENDYYAFDGRAGDLINVEVFSYLLASRAVNPIANPIDSILRLYDAAGKLVTYYTGSAVNDDGFEGTRDATLVDVILPADGTYYLEVDTFATELADSDIGQYELFVYRFDTGNLTDAGDLLVGLDGNDTLEGYLGNDTLEGGPGDDLLNGGAGDDTFILIPGGSDAIVDPSGRDRLDFSGAASGVTLNLGASAGQAQTINASGDVLSITGTIDIVIGTVLADHLDASTLASGVVLFGGDGPDTLAGGAGADILIGGAGDDSLNGGAGRDLVIGGNGSDALSGGADDDILIGGRTTFDADLVALDAILAEWTGPGSYDLQVDHLTGAQPGGLNGLYLLISGTTVLDDGVRDTLTGGLGMDVFFAFALDSLTDIDRRLKERKV